MLAVATLAVLAEMRGTQDAVANGDTRTISIRHMHTKEETTVTFKRDGRYVAEALEKLNWALRDWRIDEPIRMDPKLFDLAWEVQRMVGSEQPFHVVSAYRSPGTNSMLRRRSRGVAKNSQHTQGRAMDFYLPDTSTVRIRESGMRLQRGGVGFYPGAHTPFIHLDAGSVRSWPRMTRDQLVRLFPDEKTVHLPADGQPLSGYELAKADIMARGGSVAGYSVADADEGAVISSGNRSLWAVLFGGDEEETQARPTRGGRAGPRPQPAVLAYAPAIRDDSNSNDGGRFATTSAAPEPVTSVLTRERSERLAPRTIAPQTTQIAALAPAPAAPDVPKADDRVPRLIDAPLPLARPRGLQGPPDAPPSTQIAALSAAGGALSFAPQGAGAQAVIASLPPRRPDQIAALIEASVASKLDIAVGRPMAAPVPPARPAAFANLALAGLRDTSAEPAQPEGKLVAVTHPLPPGRPRSEGFELASVAVPASRSATAPPASQAPTAPTPLPTPLMAQFDADRAGLDSLFAAVARSLPSEGRPVTVATARARTTQPAPGASIEGPGPAASLGFSHAEPGDAKTGSFSGAAVRALPTTFIQN